VYDNDLSAILITKVDSRGVHCTDGKTGQKEIIPFNKVEGTLYAISKIDEEEAELNKKDWSARNFSRFKMLMAQMFFISLIMNVMMLVVPLYILTIYDRVIPSKSIDMLYQLCIGAVLVVIAVRVLFSIRVKMIAYVNARMNKTIGEIIIRTLMYLPVSYLENDPIASQMSRIKEFDSMREFFAETVAAILVDLPFIVVFIIAVGYLGGFL